MAATQARVEDMEHREKKLLARYEQLADQYNQAKQESAVAKKEVEMLREQTKKNKLKKFSEDIQLLHHVWKNNTSWHLKDLLKSDKFFYRGRQKVVYALQGIEF